MTHNGLAMKRIKILGCAQIQMGVVKAEQAQAKGSNPFPIIELRGTVKSVLKVNVVCCRPASRKYYG